MKKTFKFLAMGAITFALCLSMNNFSSAKDSEGLRIAVVNGQQIVESSPKIAALKIEQKNKVTDLVKFVEDAKVALAKETDAKKKKSLEENYNKELIAKKEAIDKDYYKKMSEIDKNINDIIKEKSSDYDLVLPKNIVLNGGTDITGEIIKSLK